MTAYSISSPTHSPLGIVVVAPRYCPNTGRSDWAFGQEHSQGNWGRVKLAAATMKGTTSHFTRFGATLGSNPGQRTAAGTDNETVPADESPRATCVFCEIVAGREPASVVYSDAGIIAFMDLHPINAGHLLVVPRAHAARLADLDERLGAAMFAAGQRLAGAIRRSGLPCQGVNLFVADGEVAGQEVMHMHLHVLPRTPGDGFRIERGSAITTRAELDQGAALVRDGLHRAD